MARPDELSVVDALAADLHARGQVEQARALETVLDLARSALTGRPTAHPREYLTTTQAAAALGVSRQTIKNWVDAGRLRGVVLGGRTLVHRDEVQLQLDRLASARPPRSAADVSIEAAQAGYRAAVEAVPPAALGRLEALHARMEAGKPLSPEEQREMVALERQVTQAATRALARRVRRRPGITR